MKKKKEKKPAVPVSVTLKRGTMMMAYKGRATKVIIQTMRPVVLDDGTADVVVDGYCLTSGMEVFEGLSLAKNLVINPLRCNFNSAMMRLLELNPSIFHRAKNAELVDRQQTRDRARAAKAGKA